MGNNIRSLIDNRKNKIAELADIIEEKLKNYPAGYIHVKHINNKSYFYLTDKDSGIHEKYLDKEQIQLLKDLLQKNYFENVLKAAKDEIQTLSRFTRSYPEHVAEDIYDLLPEDKKEYITPIIATDDQYVKRWQEMPYVQKPISDDLPYYGTMRGERVRSKSEMIIADRLYLSGIPYKYECPLVVGGRVIHPDFTILRVSDRKVVYHEHLGKADNEEYLDDNVSRINDYIIADILIGDRLFLSLESSKTPLDVRVIDKMIQSHYK